MCSNLYQVKTRGESSDNSPLCDDIQQTLSTKLGKSRRGWVGEGFGGRGRRVPLMRIQMWGSSNPEPAGALTPSPTSVGGDDAVPRALRL